MSPAYEEYLKSPEWKTKRKAVKERCKNICERCHRYLVDDVHHLTYVRKFNERLEDLQGLCAGCHEFMHGKSGIDPLQDSIEVKVTYRLIQYLDCNARKFRKVRISKLPDASNRVGWTTDPNGEYCTIGNARLEPGIYRVPMAIFLDEKGKPVLDTSRWNRFKECSRLGRQWYSGRRRPRGRHIPDQYAKEEAARAKKRQQLEQKMLKECPEKFTSFQGDQARTLQEVRRIYKKWPRIVHYGREYRILNVHAKKWRGMVLDLECDTNTGWIRIKIYDADACLAEGKILLHQERGIWIVKDESTIC